MPRKPFTNNARVMPLSRGCARGHRFQKRDKKGTSPRERSPWWWQAFSMPACPLTYLQRKRFHLPQQGPPKSTHLDDCTMTEHGGPSVRVDRVTELSLCGGQSATGLSSGISRSAPSHGFWLAYFGINLVAPSTRIETFGWMKYRVKERFEVDIVGAKGMWTLTASKLSQPLKLTQYLWYLFRN